MDVDTFWSLIEAAQVKQEDGWIELDHNALIEALIQLPAEDIHEFDHIFFRLKAKAYRADLWDAAYLVECGCSDDGFSDVGDWLIRMGQEIYERVLNDPDNLADIVPRVHRFELYDVSPDREFTILFIAQDAYERKMGEPIPYWGYEEVPKLIGESVPEEEFPAKYPRIMEKLGQYSDEDFAASL